MLGRTAMLAFLQDMNMEFPDSIFLVPPVSPNRLLIMSFVDGLAHLKGDALHCCEVHLKQAALHLAS